MIKRMIQQPVVAVFLGMALAFGSTAHIGLEQPSAEVLGCDPGGCSGTGGAVPPGSAPTDMQVNGDPGGVSGTGGAR